MPKSINFSMPFWIDFWMDFGSQNPPKIDQKSIPKAINGDIHETLIFNDSTTLFVDVLNFLKNRPKLSIFLGIILGPGSYYSGVPLGIANYANLNLGLVFMAIFWGILMFVYTIYIKNIKPISDL